CARRLPATTTSSNRRNTPPVASTAGCSIRWPGRSACPVSHPGRPAQWPARVPPWPLPHWGSTTARCCESAATARPRSMPWSKAAHWPWHHNPRHEKEETAMRSDESAAPGLVRQDIADGVLVLSMNDPGTGNAMSVDMAQALADALEQANTLPDVHCVLLR